MQYKEVIGSRNQQQPSYTELNKMLRKAPGFGIVISLSINKSQKFSCQYYSKPNSM